MKETSNNLESLVEVDAVRIDTQDDSVPPQNEQCSVAVEGPVTIDLSDFGQYTLLCTPDDKIAMTVGFLFSEGMIDTFEDIEVIRECSTDDNVVRVKLASIEGLDDRQGRNLLIISSCGICGSESMDEKLSSFPVVGDTLRISPATVRRATKGLSAEQVLFSKSGGTHAISLFDSEGNTVSFAEDIGRHNALDKAIGKCIVNGVSTRGLGAAMSGRISLEMVGKCARAGIELICAVSAPTSLALDAARRCDITVLAFVRSTRATIFEHPKPIILPNE